MIVIEQKQKRPQNLEGLYRDSVTLAWEDRRKSRQKLTTRSGLEIALALPTGSILEDGDVIYLDKERYVVVEAALEEVLCVYPARPEDYALAAYEIGNRHLPLSIARDFLCTPFEPMLEAHLKKHGLRCECRSMPFEPIRKGHSHG